MKILVAYYSRTGTTQKVAEAIASKKGAEIEEIKDTVKRSGAKGYLISGRNAMRRKLTQLEPVKFNPADYDLVIVGTPIWAWNISVPVRTYLAEQKDKFKQVAFFCTMGGSGDAKVFQEMEKIIGQKPIAVFSTLTKEVAEDNYSEKLDVFLKELNMV